MKVTISQHDIFSINQMSTTNSHKLKPNSLETCNQYVFSLACAKMSRQTLANVAAMNYAMEAKVKYRNVMNLGVDVGTAHLGISLVGPGTKRKWWNLLKMSSTLSTDTPWCVVELLNNELFPVLKMYMRSWHIKITIECQPVNKMKRVADCIETWFYTKGWKKEDVQSRSATAKMTIFEDESMELIPLFIDKWFRASNQHDKNKQVGIMRAHSGLILDGDIRGVRDLEKWRDADKEDDVSDAYLYACKEAIKQTQEVPESRRKERMLKARRKHVPYGRVIIK